MGIGIGIGQEVLVVDGLIHQREEEVRLGGRGHRIEGVGLEGLVPGEGLEARLKGVDPRGSRRIEDVDIVLVVVVAVRILIN